MSDDLIDELALAAKVMPDADVREILEDTREDMQWEDAPERSFDPKAIHWLAGACLHARQRAEAAERDAALANKHAEGAHREMEKQTALLNFGAKALTRLTAERDEARADVERLARLVLAFPEDSRYANAEWHERYERRWYRAYGLAYRLTTGEPFNKKKRTPWVDDRDAALAALTAERDRMREALRKKATREEFDYPGDAPVSCGMWCELCEQSIDDDTIGGHAPSCLLALEDRS